MDADEMDVDLDGAAAADEIDSPFSVASASPASAAGSLPGVLSELAALHRRASSSSSSSASPSLSLPSITFLSSSPAAVASLFPRLAATAIPASSLLPPLEASLTAHQLPAAVAYLRLLLAPASPLLTLFSPLPFLSLLLAIRKAASSAGTGGSGTVNPSSGSGGGGNPRKRKNQRHQPPPAAPRAAPSLLPRALSLLADAAGRLPLGAHPDARRSLIDTAAELAAFDVLAAVLGSDYHAEAVPDVVRAIAPVVLSGTKSGARVAAVQFLVTKLVPLGAVEGEDVVRKAVGYLPRYLAVKAPDKAEGRALAVEAIFEVARALGAEEREGFAGYVVAMSKGKAKGRLVAVDLVLAMLPVLLPSDEDDHDLKEGSWGLKCLRVLVERCSDSVGGVRARALTNAAQALDVLSERGVEVDWLQEVMRIGDMGLGELLRRRCTDDKAAVRKAALVLITKAIGLIGRPVDESLLCAMGAACSDPLVSIRKAALAAISEVFRKFPDEKVMKEWLQAVPPLVIDSETSIQEECENLFLELVLNRICQAANLNLDDDSVTLEEVFPEGTLDLLKSICDGEVAPCIKKICASLGKKKKLKPLLATSLQNIITISESLWLRSHKPIENWTAPIGSWWLLSEVSSFAPKSVNWKFLSHHWKLLDNVGQDDRGKACSQVDPNSALWAVNRVSLLQTISNVSMELPVEPAAELAHSLLTRIENFDMNLSEVIKHLLATSAKLCAEILAAVCDGLLSVDDAGGRAVLQFFLKQDALQILACKEMRIHPNICAENTDMDDEGGEGGGAASALQAAKGRAVTQVAKKNLIQIAVPIFIELKRLLESKNSPLTGCLMECLRALLKDYKNEIEEILVADKQLQKELLYDMQKYEAGKGKGKAAAEAEAGPSGTARSPAGQTPAGAAAASVDASARATVRSVLKEVHRNTPPPPLHSMSVLKVKSILGSAGPGSRRPDILESVRRLQPFESDDEN
ncbi:hypothetical protein BAE44_0019341 [Dichanthelium oligosanthes]|uniref:Condensin-2 complex subunit D3 n=1 Tax=Dichanthelium oligosanthes TaxID=888268 RepID=A0A1E5V3A4_9POAL|nr:hypothetical protein BAE44_0019341 [Dichanthelium oligosanthes]